MRTYICQTCGDTCDAWDLINNKCHECREAENNETSKATLLEQKWDRLVIKTKGQLRLAIENSNINN